MTVKRTGSRLEPYSAALLQPPAKRPQIRPELQETPQVQEASYEAGATGLEPATSGVTGRRSNRLSYAPVGGTVWQHVTERSGVHQPARRGQRRRRRPRAPAGRASRAGVFCRACFHARRGRSADMFIGIGTLIIIIILLIILL